MATPLKKTNVVVVGLGAAGGTAVLPLTNAGLMSSALKRATGCTRATLRPMSCAKKLNWHPFPGAALINSQAYGGRSGCV